MEAAGLYPAEINMGLTEILLIILGILAFIGSFIIPGTMEKDSLKEIKRIEENVKDLVQKEVNQASLHIEEKMDETISAASDKAERYMERLSNEKIMAIQEYSDTVLSQINRNHEEAVFLYDMLNNKHVQVKNTIADFNNRVQNVKMNYEQTLQEHVAEASKESLVTITEMKNDPLEEDIVDDKIVDYVNESDKEPVAEIKLENGNNKSKILKFHEEGVPTIEIAKSLGLGIGEVQLIIDLYENGE